MLNDSPKQQKTNSHKDIASLKKSPVVGVCPFDPGWVHVQTCVCMRVCHVCVCLCVCHVYASVSCMCVSSVCMSCVCECVMYVCVGGVPTDESKLSVLLQITSRDYCLAKKVLSAACVSAA